MYRAAEALDIPIEQILDFSASINPLGLPAGVFRVIRSALKQIVHYPDPECWELRQLLAQQCRVDPSMILVGNGSTELIHLLPRALAIKSALIVGPTFAQYAHALMIAGSEVQYVHARRDERYRPPVTEVIRQLSAKGTRYDAVFVCNPNNPTGQVIPRSVLCELAEVIERRQGWLIVDEAFVDYCQTESVVSLLRGHPRIVVLRSLTKFYAMPGLRIGYLIGARTVVDRLKDQQPPWSVNSLAQTVSCAVLRDRAYVLRSRACMKRERSRLVSRLRAVSGVRVYPSAANFLLLELPASIGAAEITARLAANRVLVRDCSALTGLTKRMIRVAIRTAKENQRLVTALDACIAGKKF